MNNGGQGLRWKKIMAAREEDGIRYLEAWDKDSSDGEEYVIAGVDMVTGKVFYSHPDARIDSIAQDLIQSLVFEAKENHPYEIGRLEGILRDVVDYECEEGTEYAEQNLFSMGFAMEEMVFFGFPESL